MSSSGTIDTNVHGKRDDGVNKKDSTYASFSTLSLVCDNRGLVVGYPSQKVQYNMIFSFLFVTLAIVRYFFFCFSRYSNSV
jgi:hypothetical protein